MNKILIATDGSPSAEQALESGLTLATEHEADVVIVHVAPSYDVLPAHAFGMSGAVPHRITDADYTPLEEAVRVAEERGVRATAKLLVGDPADEIVAYADSIDADLVVVGSHGRGAIASAIIGSVSRGVLHQSHRPVLVVRATAPEPSPALAR